MNRCKICGAIAGDTGLCPNCLEEIRRESMYKCPVLTAKSDTKFNEGGSGELYLKDLRNLAFYPQ